MKTTRSLAFRFPRIDRTLEAVLFTATTIVITGGVIAVFARLGMGLA